MRNLACFIIVLSFSTSCVTAPKYHSFEKSWTMPSDYDVVWEAIIEFFAENNWPIDTLEKASGIISSEWVGLPRKTEICDCGGSGITSV
jgi:hypothetical protein